MKFVTTMVLTSLLMISLAALAPTAAADSERGGCQAYTWDDFWVRCSTYSVRVLGYEVVGNHEVVCVECD